MPYAIQATNRSVAHLGCIRLTSDLTSPLSTVVRPLPSQHASATNLHAHARTEASAYTGRPPACLTPDKPPATCIPGPSCRCLSLKRQITPPSARSAPRRLSETGGNKRKTPARTAHPNWPLRPSRTPHVGVELGFEFIAVSLLRDEVCSLPALELEETDAVSRHEPSSAIFAPAELPMAERRR